MGKGTADLACLSFHGFVMESTSREDAAISAKHFLVTFVSSLLVDIEAISVFHDELAGPHDSEAGSDFIPEFGLDLIEINGHLTIRTDLSSCKVRDHLLMGRPEAAIPVMAIPEPQEFFAIFLPPMALLPEISGLNEREQDLDCTRPVHLLTDDLFYLSKGPEAVREVRIDARGQLPDHSRPEHELMAGYFCLGRDFLQGGKKVFRISHFESSALRSCPCP
jgi:hypothetical protein